MNLSLIQAMVISTFMFFANVSQAGPVRTISIHQATGQTFYSDHTDQIGAVLDYVDYICNRRLCQLKNIWRKNANQVNIIMLETRGDRLIQCTTVLKTTFGTSDYGIRQTSKSCKQVGIY